MIVKLPCSFSISCFFLSLIFNIYCVLVLMSEHLMKKSPLPNFLALVQKELHLQVSVRAVAEWCVAVLSPERVHQCSLYQLRTTSLKIAGVLRSQSCGWMLLGSSMVMAARVLLIYFSSIGDVIAKGIPLGSRSSSWVHLHWQWHWCQMCEHLWSGCEVRIWRVSMCAAIMSLGSGV